MGRIWIFLFTRRWGWVWRRFCSLFALIFWFIIFFLLWTKRSFRIICIRFSRRRIRFRWRAWLLFSLFWRTIWLWRRSYSTFIFISLLWRTWRVLRRLFSLLIALSTLLATFSFNWKIILFDIWLRRIIRSVEFRLFVNHCHYIHFLTYSKRWRRFAFITEPFFNKLSISLFFCFDTVKTAFLITFAADDFNV